MYHLLRLRNHLLTFLLCCFSLAAFAESGMTLQVLGSGGPNDIDGRASAGYLVWLDGKARVMVDAGGGTSLRFGQTDAEIEDLDVIAISHLHVDHSVDVITMIKRGYFYDRQRPLPVAGPSGNDLYPDMTTFIQQLFAQENSPYRYMILCEGYPLAEPITLDATQGTQNTVLKNDHFTLTALGVKHADTPALAFRIDTAHGSVAFSGDQNGSVPEFIDFVKDVDILVMNFPLQETDNEGHNYWHTVPSRVGKIAAQANVKKLVLSHFMVHSLNNIEASVDIVKSHYSGPIILAEDLACLSI